MFQYKRLAAGLIGSNTYILWDEQKQGAVIDCGNSAETIQAVTDEQKIEIRYIILTHVHFDHICFLADIRSCFPKAEVICHEADSTFFGNPRLNASVCFGSERRFEGADRTVTDGAVLPLSQGAELKVIATPDHTPGSICIQADNLLFTGDTLFYGGFGRTDLGAGSMEELSASIRRLYQMDPGLLVLPGHGTTSSIGREKAENPFYY